MRCAHLNEAVRECTGKKSFGQMCKKLWTFFQTSMDYSMD